MDNVTVFAAKRVYKKAYLHACKYANDDITGILVGSLNGFNYKISDAFPLFHTRILQCPLEVALDLITAQLPKEVEIIGIYEARVASVNVSEIAKELLEVISSKLRKDALYMKVCS